MNKVVDYLSKAKYPILLLGGGAKGCDKYILEIVNKINPIVITTTNARGLLGNHPMCIPASPTLLTVRKELKKADIVLAVGTEFGETDYDMYKDGNFPKLKKYYYNVSNKVAYVVDNGKKSKLGINKKATFKNMKVSAAFHGYLSLNKQKKIPKILKMMQFPCSDALSYAHFCEGKLDVVIQCMNKIWDIHPLIPIIKASGGIASTWRNENANKAGNVLISANKNIHIKMLRLLKPALK